MGVRGGKRDRSTLASLMAFALVLLSWTSAGADESPAPVSSELYCPIAVAAVVPVDTDANDEKTATAAPTITIALLLSAYRADGKKSLASGTIAIFVGDERYDVPFADAVAVGRYEDLRAATPIVVRFPGRAAPTGAYVAALDGAGGGRCGVGNAWTSGRRVDIDTSTLRPAIQGSPVTTAPAPVFDPPPPCPNQTSPQ
jgi:hypothetical protein